MTLVSRIRLYRTEAIVLKRLDFGEADRILTLYTPDRGKVCAIAKGVRRIASRKSGHLELFTHAGLLLAEGRNLDVVTQAETVRAFRRVREDLIRTTYAYHMAELVDRFVQEGLESPPTFNLLRDCLAALTEAEDPTLVARYFEVKLLGQMGYRPQLFQCVRCTTDLDPDGNAFSPVAGGVVCPACVPRQPDAIALSDSAFRVLRFLQTRDWAVARRIELTAATRGALEQVMGAYVRHLLERDLQATNLLKQLRAAASDLQLRTGGWPPPSPFAQTAD
jgi:DNA repair protein RecO (recombination protein O)